MALTDDIIAALTTAGYSNIRAYRFDNSPDTQICVIPGGGSAYIVSGGDVEHPKVQIQARNTNLQTCQTTILAIRDLLHKNDSLANSVSCIWDGRFPDYWSDENDRHIFSIEFKVIRAI